MRKIQILCLLLVQLSVISTDNQLDDKWPSLQNAPEDQVRVEETTIRPPVSEILMKTGLRTSMIYLIIIMVIYFTLLFDVKLPIAQLLRNLGVVMGVLVLAVYIATTYYGNSAETYYFVTRLIYFLLVLTLFYIFLCLFEYYVFWPYISRYIIRCWRKISRMFQPHEDAFNFQ